MAITFTSRSPAAGYSITTNLVTLSATANESGYIADKNGLVVVALYWSVNGGGFQVAQVTGDYAENLSVSTTLRNLRPGDRIDWLVYARTDAIWDYPREANSDTRTATVAADSSGPTLSPVTPADAAAGAPPVAFSVTAADDYGVESMELWVDGVKVREVLGISSNATYYDNSYTLDWSVSGLAAGAVSWYAKATDINGNVTTLPTRTYTVTNAAPTTPGAPTLAATVGQGGSVLVSWAASSDYNGDALTYNLEEKYGAGAYSSVATGITSTSYVWTPSSAGTAWLHVQANDGTAVSGWAESAQIIVVANTAPNAPTLTAPGAVTWREGETQNITWTEASPRDADGHAVTYEGEFSALGDFTDAVAIFSGVAQGSTSYAWTLATTLVAANTATCKVRIRARDIYNGISTWSTSAPFTVNENATPTITIVSPADLAVLTDSTPTITYEVTDADSDKLHVEIEISELADFSTVVANPNTQNDVTGWEASAHPHAVWSAFDAGGEDSGDQVRFTVQSALRYDYYYIRARVTDTLLTSAWTDTVRVLIRYSSTDPVYVTIDSTVWSVENLVVNEETGGEPSMIEFTLPTSLVVAAANAPAQGDSVTVGCNIEGTSRSWNATVEEIRYDGPYVHISCLQDDAYLSRKLATGDVASKDVGQALKDLITSYGSPLSGAGIDVTSGTTAALTGGYKSLREHFSEWTDALLRYMYVDETGDVKWVDPADLAVPAYVLTEGE